MRATMVAAWLRQRPAIPRSAVRPPPASGIFRGILQGDELAVAGQGIVERSLPTLQGFISSPRRAPRGDISQPSSPAERVGVPWGRFGVVHSADT